MNEMNPQAAQRLRCRVKAGLIRHLHSTGCITALQRDELLRRLRAGGSGA